MANKNKKTDKDIILAIDEPEISMHISNCFNQFSRLEELSKKDIQVIVTTHWYGYLPIAQNGMMHYVEQRDGQPHLRSFSLYNLLETKRNYPDDVELKSKAMLKDYKNLHIIPLGGCGNVVKLYQILVGFMTEKSEEAKADALFLIDTDVNRVSIREPFEYSTGKTSLDLRRLQVINGEIKLLDPFASGAYSQTEMEDCLNPEIYYRAIEKAILNTRDRSLKGIFKKYEFVTDATSSMIRGDYSCIRATDAKYIPRKQQILDFIEADDNKRAIAGLYAELCEGKDVDHALEKLITDNLGLDME